MLAYWNGQFYYQYLADPSDEHVPPSQTFLMTSKDGYQWTNPEIVFPPYKVPDGYTKESRPGMQAKDLIAIMPVSYTHLDVYKRQHLIHWQNKNFSDF